MQSEQVAGIQPTLKISFGYDGGVTLAEAEAGEAGSPGFSEGGLLRPPHRNLPFESFPIASSIKLPGPSTGKPHGVGFSVGEALRLDQQHRSIRRVLELPGIYRLSKNSLA
ncbi:MAG: hypothetical protein DRP71_13180 [Verrucomicrobia bacterium]|nr:MAG: hypothetical protein DRP71_13180 [Verrucomicrobiota bacterium]